MKLSNLVVLPFIISSSVLTGCASIVNGTTQHVSVSTPPIENADCKLVNNKGEWLASSTPTSVGVHRSYQDLEVTCIKEGYGTRKEKFKSKTKGMAFGNILFGGVIGAGVDMGNGAAYDYPQTLVVPMTADAKADLNTKDKIAQK